MTISGLLHVHQERVLFVRSGQPIEDVANMSSFMVYGATGYTGSLIVREAVRRAMRPILGGRSAEKLATLAGALQLEQRVFSLDSPDAVVGGLRGVHTLLNCAGPFSQTARPMVDACLKTGAHYLDITGEADIFESLAARDAEAKAAGIVLLPGVGFDVVPSDCLAVHLKRRLPTATRLTLAFQSGARLSRGTALTVLEGLGEGGLVRANGVLRRVPAAWKTRVIDFGNGPVKAITIPWGDVATAYHSTGIPNIEVYLAAPWTIRVAARLSRYFGWLLGSTFVQKRLKRRILAGPAGPTETERQQNRCFFWGEAMDGTGHKVIVRQQTPDGYELTVQASLAAVARVLSGMVSPGFKTPAMEFGPDFVLEIPGVTRLDELKDRSQPSS
jgi:short subunit dehydrogenase-like uncharacterized protein